MQQTLQLLFKQIKSTFSPDHIGVLLRGYPNFIEIHKTTRGYTYTAKLRCIPGGEEGLINRLKEIDLRVREEFKLED